MKSNEKYNDYAQLRRKTYIKGIQITAIAVGTILLIRSLTQGKLGTAIVDTIRHLSGLDYYDIVDVYQTVISGNTTFIIALVIIVFMLILFQMLLTSYTAYFDEVVIGIDKISYNNNEKINLSPELKSVEEKLNELKFLLQTQEEDRKKAEQQKIDLILYLAHDIKTPLTSVSGYLSLLEMKKDLQPDEKEKYIHIANQKAARLENLINEFFEITQYSSNNLSINKVKIDLSYMVLQISEELYPQLKENNKSIENGIADDMIVWADPEKFARVLGNLIKNAIAYSDRNSTIFVSAYETLDKSFIEVKSRGAISENDLDTVFDKFKRLDKARSSTTGGSGLGLAIAQDIINLHSGIIKAISDDEFTTFLIEIPKVSIESQT